MASNQTTSIFRAASLTVCHIASGVALVLCILTALAMYWLAWNHEAHPPQPGISNLFMFLILGIVWLVGGLISVAVAMFGAIYSVAFAIGFANREQPFGNRILAFAARTGFSFVVVLATVVTPIFTLQFFSVIK